MYELKNFLLSSWIYINCFAFSQNLYNPDFIKFINQKINFNKSEINKESNKKVKLYYSNYTFLNTNLPNLENLNGLYLPKGVGIYNSFMFTYKSKNLLFSIEPRQSIIKNYNYDLIEKNKEFSVLNDIPFPNYKLNQFNNTGFNINYKKLSFGYGNWNEWWGPGLHSSLTKSNNAQPYFNGYISYHDETITPKNIDFYFKVTTSEPIKNSEGYDYYITQLFSKVFYKNIEFGISKSIQSGGYEDIKWNFYDAALVYLNKKFNIYWDEFITLYIQYADIEGLELFYEVGRPVFFKTSDQNNTYYDNAIATNLGIRKFGLFDNENLFMGFEYTRLVQGIYYNIIPTPNWYDNYKYNYSSYKNRRWGAHSGSDSDDMFIFGGISNKEITLVTGINYERHGITYNFPPEVKFELKTSFSYSFDKLFLSISIENELFRHYGFVDKNRNVWTEEFENGSIQRSNTVLINFDYSLH